MQQSAGVEIRLENLKKHLESKSDKFVLMLQTIQDGVSRMAPHLLESMTMTQLWNLEVRRNNQRRIVLLLFLKEEEQQIETWVNLSKDEELIGSYVCSLVQTQPGDAIVSFVSSLLEMLTLGHDEKTLKG